MAMMGNGSARGEGRARTAAKPPCPSPLLEHVDLADAGGILVNVTAGMDMSIGEFQEVGNIVKEFASDEATIVMGTVIDPEMKEEMRVTVVATGLNRVAQNTRGRGDTAFLSYRDVAREPMRSEPARGAAKASGTDAGPGCHRLRQPRHACRAALRSRRRRWHGAGADERGAAGYPGFPAPAGGLIQPEVRLGPKGNIRGAGGMAH